MKKLISVLLAAAAVLGSAQTVFAATPEEQPIAAQAEESTVAAQAEESTVAAQAEESTVAAQAEEPTVAAQAEESTVAAQAEETTVAAQEDYPKINLLENREDGVKIGWTKYPGAAKYRVFILTDGKWKGIGNSECLSLVHKISKSNTKYTYTVRAMDSNGSFISAYFKEGWQHEFVVTPSITKIENIDGGSTLTWPARSGVKYRLFYRDADNRWRALAKTSTNSYTHKGLKNGETRTYTIRYENNSGQFISPYNNNGWKNTYVAPPVISSITRDKTVLNIKWNSNSYAERYRVYRKQGSDKWQTLGDTTSTVYTDNKLMSGVKYTYVIRALNAKATRYTSALGKTKWKIAVTDSKMSEFNRKLREDMIAFLGKQVGNNNRKYIDYVNKYGKFGLTYGTQWCAVFGWSAMDWFARDRGDLKCLVPPRWHVSEIANEARKYGAWHNTFSTNYEAKPGDVFMTSFQKYPYSDGRTHVGYIEYVDKDKNGKVTYIHTVEGNFNWEVGDNSKTVVGRSRWKDRLEKDHGAMVTDYLDIEKIIKAK